MTRTSLWVSLSHFLSAKKKCVLSAIQVVPTVIEVQHNVRL
jgi:hypothetical protein